ncbi:hypothetical protein ES703_87974 [subsurface metagenome]
MATLKRQKARKHYVCSNSSCKKAIKVGDEYYKFSLTRFQKLRPLCLACKPTRSQMTGSDFLATLFDIEDSLSALSVEAMEDAQGTIDEIIGQLEELRDETEGRRDNMPEQLQDAPTGEMLQGRVDSVDEMLGELEDIETDIDEELSEEEKEDRKEEILQAIQDVCYNGE